MLKHGLLIQDLKFRIHASKLAFPICGYLWHLYIHTGIYSEKLLFLEHLPKFHFRKSLWKIQKVTNFLQKGWKKIDDIRIEYKFLFIVNCAQKRKFSGKHFHFHKFLNILKISNNFNAIFWKFANMALPYNKIPLTANRNPKFWHAPQSKSPAQITGIYALDAFLLISCKLRTFNLNHGLNFSLLWIISY